MAETVPKRQIPLSVPTFAGNEMKYLQECIENGWVSTAGPKVSEFERAIAGYLGASQAVACVNGTAAIHLCLLGVGVGPGDEVLVPSLTFIGSINPILYTGATPVFVDVDPTTLTVDPAALSATLEGRYHKAPDGRWMSAEGKRLGAVLTVDLYGHPADYDAITEVVAAYGTPIVEDAAEALGATCRGRKAGRLGTVSALSFNGNKVLTTGGGGMVVTDDTTLAARLRHLSTQARADRIEYTHDDVGYNYRLTNLQAALGLAQLEQLDGFLATKRRRMERYRERLSEYAGVRMVQEREWAHSSYWLATVTIDALAASRDRLRGVVEESAEAGVELRPLFTPAHLQPLFNGRPDQALPNTEEVFATGLNLPSSSSLAEEDVDFVVETLARTAELLPRRV